MIICALTALPSYSASVESFESVEGVFRVQNQSEIESFQAQLRRLLKQRDGILARLENLMGDAKFFANSNPENEVLIDNMGLTFDPLFVDSMGAEFCKVNVRSYKSDRRDLTKEVRVLQDYCSLCRRNMESHLAKDLMAVDRFLTDVDQTEGARALQDYCSLCFRDTELCSHADQDPDPWENVLEGIKDVKSLMKEHFALTVACMNSVDGIAQKRVFPPPSIGLSKLCDKSVLKRTLENYSKLDVRALNSNMIRFLDLLTKCVARERFFRSRDNPLVVLQEKCAEFSLHQRCEHLRDKLDKFVQMEHEISTRLERLAGCAIFFKQYDFKKDVRRFPQLSMDHAEWYDSEVRLNATEFMNTADCLRSRMEVRFSDIVRAQKRLHDSDEDIVLPPIQFECGFQENDLCGNLKIFIKILKEIKDWEASQSRKKESLQRSVFGVLCDQTAEATLGDKFPYIRKMNEILLGPLANAQHRRSEVVDEQLLRFSEFLKTTVSQRANPADKMYRFLELWSEYLKQDIAFVKDPLVLKKCCDNVRCHLDQFLQMEYAINKRIESLSGCAYFFLQNTVENDILWPNLSPQKAEWYKEWGSHLYALANKFIVEGAEYKRMHGLFSSHKYLPANDANSVLPPTQADCEANAFHTNDWGCNLHNFIARLQGIHVWGVSQTSQGAILYSSVLEMWRDQAAEHALGDKFPDPTELQCRLGKYLSLINSRCAQIDQYLYSFLEILNARNCAVKAVRYAQGSNVSQLFKL